MAEPVSDGDRELLGDILERRRPEILPLVGDVGRRPLSGQTLDQMCLAVVDEVCETPADGTAARRVLALEELLAGLVTLPPGGASRPPPR